MSSSNALETVELSHHFGAKMACSKLNIKVPHGSFYGFLGANGAGKTTAIRAILGLIKPTHGTSTVFGESGPLNRKHLGALVETPVFFEDLSTLDNLLYLAPLRNCSHNDARELLNKMGLWENKNDPARTLSLGMRQRLGIARALLGDPKLLILDEPTNGLDPEWRKIIRNILEEKKNNGTTIFMSSHLLLEIEQMCTHIGVLKEGKLIFQGPFSSLDTHKSQVLVNSESPEKLQQFLENHNDISILKSDASGFLIGLKNKSSAQLNRELHLADISLSALIPQKVSLESTFLDILSEDHP
ncbi:MAG: multidrug ABC transporter ATP-binding protein [Proteobacteria bacterium]|nr:multidrug ABC transporter ATP-binding protein [Pseudomonadota bacterium]